MALAYVFWHWPNPAIPLADYEQMQVAFHAALRQSSPDGFLGSSVFRIAGSAPWLAPAAEQGTPAYADWYLVENAAALDPLNVAAVSGVCEQPHDAVARAMAQGAGTLLALRAEDAHLPTARACTFLTKPRPMPYDAFYAEISSFSASPSSLWRRQMVLGPTPEFALLTPSPLTLPETFTPLPLQLTPIES